VSASGTGPDVFERLRAADPAAAAPPFDPASAQGQAVLERALSGARRRRGPRRFAAVALVVAAAAGAAAAGFLDSRKPAAALDVACYTAARLDASASVVRARPDRAVEACRTLWRDGTLGPAASPPHLVACVLSTGVVAVFPGGPGTCAELHRPVASPGPSPAVDKVATLRDRLIGASNATGCLAPDEARADAEGALRDLGISGWSVVVGPGASGHGFDADRPCATFAFEQDRKQIVLVPFPRH
jgi:hypothetical protein